MVLLRNDPTLLPRAGTEPELEQANLFLELLLRIVLVLLHRRLLFTDFLKSNLFLVVCDFESFNCK